MQSGQETKAVKITSTGAVLVSFNDRDAARIAKERTNGALFNNRALEVYYFEPKEVRELNKLNMRDKQAIEDRNRKQEYGDAIAAPGNLSKISDSGMINILSALLGSLNLNTNSS